MVVVMRDSKWPVGTESGGRRVAAVVVWGKGVEPGETDEIGYSNGPQAVNAP